MTGTPTSIHSLTHSWTRLSEAPKGRPGPGLQTPGRCPPSFPSFPSRLFSPSGQGLPVVDATKRLHLEGYSMSLLLQPPATHVQPCSSWAISIHPSPNSKHSPLFLVRSGLRISALLRRLLASTDTLLTVPAHLLAHVACLAWLLTVIYHLPPRQPRRRVECSRSKTVTSFVLTNPNPPWEEKAPNASPCRPTAITETDHGRDMQITPLSPIRQQPSSTKKNSSIPGIETHGQGSLVTRQIYCGTPSDAERVGGPGQ